MEFMRLRPEHPVLTCGPLRLDTGARTLHGPAGLSELLLSPYAVLRSLMAQPGMVVETPRLVSECWPDPDLEPECTEHALRQRVTAARAAIRRVGGPERMLRSVYGFGYVMDGPPRVVRAYTPAQAAALDRLLATHPDQAAVAAVLSAPASSMGEASRV